LIERPHDSVSNIFGLVVTEEAKGYQWFDMHYEFLAEREL
jgi:hypothetical protein